MTEADKIALKKLLGGSAGTRASTDDLQGLLLQVTLALLMVFMIAYFIFVQDSRKERSEEILALNRQKLVLALEKTAEDRRIRYGLNALMTQGTDGRRTFDADEYVKGGALEIAPAAKSAFASGSVAAAADYRDPAALSSFWKTNVLAVAGLSEARLQPSEIEWFDAELARHVENVRLDARGVQRALAARLQKQWIANPSALGDLRDAGEIADRLRRRSLELVTRETGAEILP